MDIKKVKKMLFNGTDEDKHIALTILRGNKEILKDQKFINFMFSEVSEAAFVYPYFNIDYKGKEWVTYKGLKYKWRMKSWK